MTSVHVSLLLEEFQWGQMHECPNVLERHLLRTGGLVQTRCTKGTWNLPLHLKWIPLLRIFPCWFHSPTRALRSSVPPGAALSLVKASSSPISISVCVEEAPSATPVFNKCQRDQERWGDSLEQLLMFPRQCWQNHAASNWLHYKYLQLWKEVCWSHDGSHGCLSFLAAVVLVRSMNRLQESLAGFVAGTFADPNVEAN